MTGQKALRSLRKELRKYNAVLVGDAGIEDAYRRFLEGYGIKPLKPTKRQLRIYNEVAPMRSFLVVGSTE